MHLRFWFTIICALAVLVTAGQSRITDSLEIELKKRSQKDEKYLDLLNEITFQYILSDPQESFSFANDAIQLADSLDDKQGMIRALTNKGNTFWLSSLYDQALSYYYRALSYHPDLRDSRSTIIIYNNIAEVFKKRNQYDSALKYYHRGLEVVPKLNEDAKPAMFYNNMGETHFQLGNMDSAIYYYNIAYENSLARSNKRPLSYVYAGLGEIAYQRSQIDSAINLYDKSLQISINLNDKRSIIVNSIRLANLLTEDGDRQEALQYLENAEYISEEINAVDLQNNSYLELSKHYEGTGEYEKALKYSQKYITLKDSIDQISFSNRLEQIKLALTSQIQLAENKILENKQRASESYIQMLAILLSIIFVIVFILIFLLNKFFKNLKFSEKTSKDLDELNSVIIRKNDEINRINKELDAQLRTTNKILEENQRLSKLGGWQYEISNHQMYWTDEVYRQLGLSPDSAAPSIGNLRKALGDHQVRKIKRGVLSVMKNKSNGNVNVTILDNKGRLNYINIELVPEFEGDKITKIYGSNHDITDTVEADSKEKNIVQSLLDLSKRTHLKTTEFKSFLQHLLEVASKTLGIERTSFWIYNSEHDSIQIHSMNGGKIEDQTEISREKYPLYFERLEQSRTIAVDRVYEEPFVNEFKDYFEENKIVSLMDSQVLLQGTMIGVICFEKTGQPVDWSYSDQRFAATLSDIISNAFYTHKNRELEQEKAALIDRLIKKNKSLREFAYVISHNLRDPVSQILGFTDLYRKPDSEDIRQDLINWIRNAAENLDRIIKDLSFVLRQQEDHRDLKDHANLEESLETVMTSLDSEIQKVKPDIQVVTKGNTSHLPIPGPFLYNLLYNLLSNSLKYRKDDEDLVIKIDCKIANSGYRIVFEDNGIGMNLDEFRDKLFKMYQRYHLEKEGRGLGLYLVKSQLESLGATIEVESEVNKGTRFIVNLPRYNEEVTLVAS